LPRYGKMENKSLKKTIDIYKAKVIMDRDWILKMNYASGNGIIAYGLDSNMSIAILIFSKTKRTDPKIVVTDIPEYIYIDMDTTSYETSQYDT
jgi:hypothetical protein